MVVMVMVVVEKSMELCCGPNPSLAVYKEISPQTRSNIFPHNCVYRFVMLPNGYTGVSSTEKEMTVLINKIPKYCEYLAQHLNMLFSSAPETSFTWEAVWIPHLKPAGKLICEQRMSNAKIDGPFHSSCNRLQPVKFVKTHVPVPLCFKKAICFILECFGSEFPQGFRSAVIRCIDVWGAKNIRATLLGLKKGRNAWAGNGNKTRIKM